MIQEKHSMFINVFLNIIKLNLTKSANDNNLFCKLTRRIKTLVQNSFLFHRVTPIEICL